MPACHRLGVIACCFLTAMVAVADLRAAENAPELRVLLLTGKNNHDWKQTTPAIEKVLVDSGRFAVAVTDGLAGRDPASLAGYDVIVSNWNNWPSIKDREWGPAIEKAFLDFVRGGKGFVVVHAASTPFQNWPEFQQIVGSTWELGKTGHGRIHRFKVAVTDKDHPITRGMSDFWITDELWHRAGKQKDIHVLCEALSAKEAGGSGELEPMVLCTTFGKGRGFNLILGHDVRAMQSAGWQLLMLRGTEWAATGKVTLPATLPKPSIVAKEMLDEATLDADVKAIVGYRFGQGRKALLKIEKWVHHAATKPELQKRLASWLAGVLGGKATLDCKRFVCSQLSLIGSASQVPALVRLLGDKDPSLAARSALERIPGDAASAAMRGAMAKAQGRTKIGLINSLGNRRDRQAVALIANCVVSSDVAIASAAVDALGKIACPDTAKALIEARGKASDKIRPLVDDALLKCADALAASGKPADARAVYDDMAAAGKPDHVRIAGFAGQVKCGTGQTDKILLGALTGDDGVLRSAAVRIAREQAGDKPEDRLALLLGRAIESAKCDKTKAELFGYLGGVRSAKALSLAAKHVGDPALADVASIAVLDIGANLIGTDKQAVKASMLKVRAATKSRDIQDRVAIFLLKIERPTNLALGATATSPDGLEKDGAANGDAAAIDGDPATYWDEQDDQKLYRLRVTFAGARDVSAISILGYHHRDYAPKDFEILCDDKVVKRVKKARYRDNELIVVFPRTRCEFVELKIMGHYGKSPAIRELGIYDIAGTGITGR